MGVGIVTLPRSDGPESRATSSEHLLGTIGSQWLRLDEALLVWEASDEAARSVGMPVQSPATQPRVEDMRVVTQVGRVFEHKHPDVRVIIDKGRYLVVHLDEEQARRVESREAVCYQVRPLPGGETVFRTVAPEGSAPVPWIETLVGEVSRGGLEDYLTHFASFPTRHSLSAEFAAAASWAREELERLGFATRTERISVDSSTSVNVIADRTGGGRESRGLVIVSAHLDSVNLAGGPSAMAPGADDNGSGAAALLEIARVLAGHRASHDLRLILFGGEEQGLHGSRQHVAALPAGERGRVRAVINMDMVATLNTAAPTVLLEGSPLSQALVDDLATAAATYTALEVQTSLDPFASDHVPFIEAGMPAVLTIEGADRGNGNVHTAEDTLAHIDYDLALDIVRMNVAASATALGSAVP